jgi:LytS/YehU family sensor histidine kinase
MEKMRFDDRLLIDIQVPEDTLGALVPNLILQPLVENAIKHGICRRPGTGRISIEASRNGRALLLIIRDDGAGLDTEKRPLVEGVGLKTTRARLEKMYGAGGDFRFVSGPGGTQAVIRLPFRVDAAERYVQ